MPQPSVKPPQRRTARWRIGAIAIAVILLGYALFDHLILLGLSVWVTRWDHGTIELVAYDETGTRLDAAGVLRRWRPTLIVRDEHGSPVFGLPYGLSAPRIAVPADQMVTLELLWNVPGFGNMLVEAVNQGRGFRVARNATITIELSPELARSRVFEVREWVDRHNGGAFASVEAAADLASAGALLATVDVTADASRRALLSIDALRLALGAGETEVLAEAREAIRTRRSGALRVKVESPSGEPLRNTVVDVRQKRFDFLFGVYSDRYDAPTVRRLRDIGLNYAILFMTWDRTQPRPGEFSLRDFDAFFTLPGADDFTVCGHALVWLSNETPQYVRQMRGDSAALLAAVREHVRGIVEHYKGTVGIWEAMNEGHPQWSRLGLDDASLIRVAKASAEEIRSAAPGTPIMIEVTLPLGEDVALKYYPFIDVVSMGRIGAASTEPYRYLTDVAKAGVPYDILALQIYNGAWMNVAGGVQVPAIDLFRFARLVDRYSEFGKPIQIAEIAVGSSGYGGASESWWHGRADEATQADYLEGVFTLAYGNPNVQGINWWGLDDSYRFVENGGLFDDAGRPKLAARRLADLLAGWRGDREARTDDDGWASFDGPAGDYRITARSGPDPTSAERHVDERKTTTVILTATNVPALGVPVPDALAAGAAPSTPAVARRP
jgi:endo-1,4-beta-xylanase